MTQRESKRVVELLIDQAWADCRESRYASAVSAAEQAVQAAETLDDPSLVIRALVIEAVALRTMGDYASALVRYTRVLGVAEDPTAAHRLDDAAIWSVATTYSEWVATARFVGGIPVRDLFGVLDAADQWLTVTGHRDWRAAILLQRASIHRRLREWGQAIAIAQEALNAYRRGAPGSSFAFHRIELGEILRESGQPGRAETHFQSVLDDPTTKPYDLGAARQGLALCALDRADPCQALHHATIAVDICESLGPTSFAVALEALVEAQRAAGELDAAWQTAVHLRETAQRIGVPYRMYHALCGLVDVAIDRTDYQNARNLLDELHRYATTLDTDSMVVTFTDAVLKRRKRLGDVTETES
jgi:tetratricopeptide (TPR) repeat protein